MWITSPHSAYLSRGVLSCHCVGGEAQQVMLQQRISKARDEDYCYRVAWRVLRDWVDTQMALVELDIVQMQEISLPYVVQKNGQTLFENIILDPGRLLT